MSNNNLILRIVVLTIWGLVHFVSIHAYQVPSIEIQKGLHSVEILSLSETTKKIEYIKLETKEECLLNSGRGYLIIADSCIYIYDKKIYKFNINGQFVDDIGSIGKGPCEYVEPNGFDYSNQSKTLYVFDRVGKVVLFDHEGACMNQVSVNPGFYSGILSPHVLLKFYPKRLAYLNNGFQISSVNLDNLIEKGYNKISTPDIENSKLLTIQNSGIYRIHDTLVFWDASCDTIYQMNKPDEIFPRYTIDYGKNKSPKFINTPQTSPKFRQIIQKYTRVTKVLESSGSLFFEINDQSKFQNLIFIKSTQNYFKPSGNMKIINDIDGGPDFWPQGTTTDGRMYQIIDMMVLLDLYNPQTGKKSINRIESKQLKRIIESSELEDNPIVMIVSEN